MRERSWRRELARLGTVLGLLAAAADAAASAGVRVQHTGSLPRGLYREVAGAPRRGALGMWCLPRDVARVARTRGYLGSGRCPSGAEPVGKLVLAGESDTVRYMPDGVLLNGQRVPNTRPLAHDAAGRPLTPAPFGTYVLRAGEVWLWSPYTPRSFDSRYFGPIPTNALLSILKPLWVWGPGRGAVEGVSSLVGPA